VIWVDDRAPISLVVKAATWVEASALMSVSYRAATSDKVIDWICDTL